MSDYPNDNNAKRFGFQIHHIFPVEIFNNDARLAFLTSVGISRDMVSNKIALPASSHMVSTFTSLQDKLAKIGWGWNTHSGSHSGYNSFIGTQIDTISADPRLDTLNKKKLAAFELLKFATDVSRGSAGLQIHGTEESSFVNKWNSQVNLSAIGNMADADVTAKLSAFSFDTTLTDSNTGKNDEARKQATDALFSEFKDTFTANQKSNAEKMLAKAGDSSGHVTSAAIGILYDIKKNTVGTTTGSAGALEYVEKASADLHIALKGSANALGFATLFTLLGGIFDSVAAHASSFAAKVEDFSKGISPEILTSIDRMTAGIGGGFLGDAVEFLNAAYSAIKKGFQTGDWSELGDVTVKYGVAVVVSAALIIGSIVILSSLAGALFGASAASVTASFVAAAWAVYGLVDAISNGVELLQKITADLASVIPKVGETMEKALIKALTDAIATYKLVTDESQFEAPDFPDDGGITTFYRVDPSNIALPDVIYGGSKGERFYGQNNAFVNAGSGNDELWFKGVGTAEGGAGDDIVAGLNGRIVKAGEAINPALPESLKADKELKLKLDGGEGNDWVFAIKGEKVLTVGGLGRDWIFNRSKGGVIYGDTENGTYEQPVLDENGVQKFDEAGNPITKIVKVEDDKSNGDNFWFYPDVTIMDAGHHDVLKFYGLPLTGGNISPGGALLGVFASITGGGGFAGGLALAGFSTTVMQQQGPTGGWFWDNLVPFITYIYDAKTRTLYVANVLDGLSSLMFGTEGGMFDGTKKVDDPKTPENESTNLTGFMKINNFDFWGSYMGMLQSDKFNVNGVKSNAGTLNMVFKQINPIAAILDLLPPTAITMGIQNAFGGGNGLVDATLTLKAASDRWVQAMKWFHSDRSMCAANDNGALVITGLSSWRSDGAGRPKDRRKARPPSTRACAVNGDGLAVDTIAPLADCVL